MKRGPDGDVRGDVHATVRVRVVPRSKRTALERTSDGGLRARLTAPPVEGAANRALIALLAEVLVHPKSAFAIARGERGRNKVVIVQGLTASEVANRLARAGE